MPQMSCSNSRRTLGGAMGEGAPGGASTSRAGRPEACSSRSRTVTPSRSSPRHSLKYRPTRSPTRTPPASTRVAMTLAVAMTFVSDAKSNGVWRSTGVGSSNVSEPTASRQSIASLVPTSAVAAGKTRDARALTRIRRASSVMPAEQQTDGPADSRADHDVPGPGQRREQPDRDHGAKRRADARHHAPLSSAGGERPQQKRPEHRPVHDRRDRQAHREDGAPIAREHRDSDEDHPPCGGQPPREVQKPPI